METGTAAAAWVRVGSSWSVEVHGNLHGNMDGAYGSVDNIASWEMCVGLYLTLLELGSNNADPHLRGLNYR